MDYTQNAKIAQVTEKTLIIGVDVGSETHYARAFSWRGQEFNKKAFSFGNDLPAHTPARTETSVRSVVGTGTEIINIDGLDVPLADGSSVYIPFVDIAKDAYYAEAVAWAYKHDPQITAGVTDLSFGPNQTCTRGQMVTFLWRAAGCPEPSGDASRFVDVASGAYYAKAVAWAVENNITNGVSPKYFGPDSSCVRSQTVTFLYRAYK